MTIQISKDGGNTWEIYAGPFEDPNDAQAELYPLAANMKALGITNVQVVPSTDS